METGTQNKDDIDYQWLPKGSIPGTPSEFSIQQFEVIGQFEGSSIYSVHPRSYIIMVSTYIRSKVLATVKPVLSLTSSGMAMVSQQSSNGTGHRQVHDRAKEVVS